MTKISRRELAQNLSENSLLPAQVLRSVFRDVIREVEVSGVKITQPLQERLWDTTSEEKLKILSEILCLETERALCDIADGEICEALIFCSLGVCEETQLERMKTVVENIKTALSLKREQILGAIRQSADIMFLDWIEEVSMKIRNNL